MPRKVSVYVQLLLSLAQENKPGEFEKKAAQFNSLLQRRGDGKLRGVILREFARRWKQLQGKEAVLLTGEDISDQLVSSLRKELEGYEFSHQRNSALKGGAALFLGSSLLIDGTIRGKLRRLFSQMH